MQNNFQCDILLGIVLSMSLLYFYNGQRSQYVEFNKFMKCNSFIETEEYKTDKFCVSTKVKRRYINPLTDKGRVYDVSIKSKEIIDRYINMKISKYVYVNI